MWFYTILSHNIDICCQVAVQCKRVCIPSVLPTVLPSSWSSANVIHDKWYLRAALICTCYCVCSSIAYVLDHCTGWPLSILGGPRRREFLFFHSNISFKISGLKIIASIILAKKGCHIPWLTVKSQRQNKVRDSPSETK